MQSNPPFSIYDTELGKLLFKIKNNEIETFKPLVVTSSKSLSANEFAQALSNGLIVDCSLGDITLTLPAANKLIEVLGGLINTLSFLSVTTFTSSLPSTNKVTFNTGPGCFFQQDQTTLDIDANSVVTLGVTIYSVSPPKLVLG